MSDSRPLFGRLQATTARIGWVARAELPLNELGRVRLPPYRITYRDGFVRLGLSPDKTAAVATLEDREGRLISYPTETDACAAAARMGHAIAVHLMRHNKYQPGESTGNRHLIQVAT